LPLQFREIELRSVEGDGARQPGEMPVDRPEFGQPVGIAIEVDDVNVQAVAPALPRAPRNSRDVSRL
jgi:hypothetical protein